MTAETQKQPAAPVAREALTPGFRRTQLAVAEIDLERALPFLRGAHTAVLRAALPDEGELEGQLRFCLRRIEQLCKKTAGYGKAAAGHPGRSE